MSTTQLFFYPIFVNLFSPFVGHFLLFSSDSTFMIHVVNVIQLLCMCFHAYAYFAHYFHGHA